MPDLKPCPFCGGTCTVFTDEPAVFWVECDNCTARGPVADTQADARHQWNNREE